MVIILLDKYFLAFNQIFFTQVVPEFDLTLCGQVYPEDETDLGNSVLNHPWGPSQEAEHHPWDDVSIAILTESLISF